MDGKFILDTNVIIALFGADSAVIGRLSAAEEVFVSAIALGELYYGAAKSGRPIANAERITEFATACVVLGTDSDTAQAYARIKNDLRAIGKPIPENDIWIAAVASQNGLTLVTRDRHFADVSGLSIEAW